jgi:hypothetical protein
MQQGDKLSEAEWNFRPLLHQKPTRQHRLEIRAAIRYGYARESEAICRMGQAFAELPEDQLEETEGLTFPKPDLVRLFTCVPFWSLIFWPKFFPRIPWLLIPHEERISRVESYKKANPPRPHLRINKWENIAEWEFPKEGGIDETVENVFAPIRWPEDGVRIRTDETVENVLVSIDVSPIAKISG